MADMAAFSLSTGLRRANVTGLRWDQVDLDNRRAWVHPDQAKARKAIPVPLNDDAMKVVARQVDKHLELLSRRAILRKGSNRTRDVRGSGRNRCGSLILDTNAIYDSCQTRTVAKSNA